MRLPDEFVQQVQQRTDLVDIVQDYLNLKRRGKDYIALCPFHHEKTPSFTVSPGKQIFKCFGCGKGGDAVAFLMEIEGISFVDAVQRLAERYQIPLPQSEHTQADVGQQQAHIKESLFIALDFARQTYSYFLWQTDEGQAVGLSYLKQRGLRHATIEKFQLGYAPNAWDALLQRALQTGYQADILKAADLIQQSEKNKDHYYDRFRHRVLFPIHNLSGRVIGFAGRTFSQDKAVAKYINSTETPLYEKSRVLYGLYHARQAIRQHDKCYVVEGYMDVLSLHQAGIEHVVATSGTSLTAEHARLLHRFTSNVTLIYDGDSAGIKAALRAIDLLLEENLNVRLVLMPEGEDPDSYLNKVGATAFEEYLRSHEEDFLHFKVRQLLKGSEDPLSKANAVRQLLESIACLPDALKQRMYIRELSQLMQVEEAWLVDELRTILFRQRRAANQNQNTTSGTKAENSRQHTTESGEATVHQPSAALGWLGAALWQHERDLIFLLLSFATEPLEDQRTFAEYILEEISDVKLQTQPFAQMLEVFTEALQQGRLLDIHYFLRHTQAEFRQAAADMLTALSEPSPNWLRYEVVLKKPEETFTENAYKGILRLKHRYLKSKEKELLEALRQTSDPAQQTALQRQLLQNKNALVVLSRMLKNTVG